MVDDRAGPSVGGKTIFCSCHRYCIFSLTHPTHTAFHFHKRAGALPCCNAYVCATHFLQSARVTGVENEWMTYSQRVCLSRIIDHSYCPQIPPPRTLHSATSNGDEIVVFGGIHSATPFQCLNDGRILFLFSTKISTTPITSWSSPNIIFFKQGFSFLSGARPRSSG